VPSRYAGDFLPTANGDVDIERIKFDYPRDSACSLGRQDGCAGASEWIEDDPIAATAVADQIRNQCNRFYGWMKFEFTVPRRSRLLTLGHSRTLVR